MFSYSFIVFVCVCLMYIMTSGSLALEQESASAYQYRNEIGEKETQQKWGYVSVRPDAHMFWWLYYADNHSQKPLVLWLQGGPGASSTGFGNFMEIGPQDVNLKPRSTTWLSEASLLYIDNPVGTGYSYVTSEDAYVTDNTMIAKDLVTLVTNFFKAVPEFQNRPFFVFSESYGGKMTAEFSQALYKAVQSGYVKCDFRGLAMGDSWISPVDYVLTWGPYLYATSLVDEAGLASINKTAQACKAAYDAGKYAESTTLWSSTEDAVEAATNNVNFYNILKWQQADDKLLFKPQSPLEKLYLRHVQPLQEDDLNQLMNGAVKKKLGIPNNVTWGGQSGQVFQKLSVDFMKPVIDVVDDLLQNTKLKVVVYNGQLDLICDTMGTEMWVQKLKWPGLPSYNKAKRDAMLNTEKTQPLAFKKTSDNLTFYWILNAGHMIPADQGDTALMMLRDVLSS